VAGRTAVIPNAVSDQVRTTAAEPVAELANRRFALVVGDASPRKNLGFVIDLWPRVLAHDPDATLVVAGPQSWGPTEHGRAYAELVAGTTVPQTVADTDSDGSAERRLTGTGKSP